MSLDVDNHIWHIFVGGPPGPLGSGPSRARGRALPGRKGRPHQSPWEGPISAHEEPLGSQGAMKPSEHSAGKRLECKGNSEI